MILVNATTCIRVIIALLWLLVNYAIQVISVIWLILVKWYEVFVIYGSLISNLEEWVDRLWVMKDKLFMILGKRYISDNINSVLVIIGKWYITCISN